jgi:predicted TIM-barrel fold metal-dependent hydrolase
VIIDAHCHVWPDDIARKVLAARPVGLSPMADGTIAGLRTTMDEAGIDRGCCLGVALSAKTVQRTNEFIGSVDRSRFFAFGTVHPGLSPDENLRSLTDNGIDGVKVHPIFQGISLSNPSIRETLQGVAELGLVVITHAGNAGEDDEANRRAAPSEVLHLAEAIPTLKLIACHYGGYHLLDEAERCLAGSSLVLETSWPPSMAELDGDRIKDIIERHGADRIVFGSDWPLADPAREISTIRGLGLSPEAQSAVLGGTLAGLLNVHDIEGESR